MDKLWIVMPAYNEEENIESVVKDWIPVVDRIGHDSKLLIVDDGSKDNTWKVLQELSARYSNLVVQTKKNEGHGPTVIYAYKQAIKAKADYIFQTDSDGQTNPEEFQSFWECRRLFSAIFGERTKRGDGKGRKFVEDVLCKILKIIFRVDIPDSNAPFRLFQREKLQYHLKKIPDDFNLPNVMLTVLFTKNELDILFKEISFKPRQAGQNSINIKKIIKIGIKAVKDFWQMRKI